MIAIAAVSRDWGIGRDNRLLFHIPEDMRFFRETTMNAAVVMGRATFESLPGGRPLEGRLNIVMSRRQGYSPKGAAPARDAREAVRAAREGAPGEVFIIGGADIYREMLPYCRLAYITKVEAGPPADRFFPDLDALPGWSLAGEIARGEHKGTAYAITIYENRKVAPLPGP